MNLGENIYKYRTQKNMSQGDLAEALEVSRQSVSKWENNSATPELDKLMKMAAIFEITLDELVTGEKREKTESAEPAPVQTELPQVINENHPESAFLSIPLFIIGISLLVLLPGHFIAWLVGVPLLLSGLFVACIGIDAYFREKRKESAGEKQPDSAVVVHVQFPVQKILGLVLICLGALAVILGLALPSMTETSSSLLTVVGLCGIVCGIFCLCLHCPQLFCGWTAWAGYLVYTFMLMPRWEEETFLMIVAALGLIVMLAWTVWAQRSGRARIPQWLLVVGGIVLALLVALFVINAMPPVFESAYLHPVTPVG